MEKSYLGVGVDYNECNVSAVINADSGSRPVGSVISLLCKESMLIPPSENPSKTILLILFR